MCVHTQRQTHHSHTLNRSFTTRKHIVKLHSWCATLCFCYAPRFDSLHLHAAKPESYTHFSGLNFTQLHGFLGSRDCSSRLSPGWKSPVPEGCVTPHTGVVPKPCPLCLLCICPHPHLLLFQSGGCSGWESWIHGFSYC